MTSLAENPAQPLRLSAGGASARRWAPVLAGVCALVLLAAVAEIAVDGALAHSALLPKQPAIAGWLAGIGERLGYRVFLIALLAFTGAYAGLLVLARRTTPGDRFATRGAIGLILALYAIVTVGPVLLSTDVFSYIAYARMGVLHGVNPYVHGPQAIVGDPIYHYVGRDWKKVATAYGPLYTLLSYPFAPLGVDGALWGMKLIALAAALGTLALTWRCAAVRGANQLFALLAVGANPLFVIYGLGGAHNDLIMTLLVMAAVALALAERDAWSGAAVIAGTLVKATCVALLPFVVLGRRRLEPLYGAALALALGALAAAAAFGVHGLNIVAALNRDAALVSTDSFPTEVAHLFGKPGVYPIDHKLALFALVLVLLYLRWRTWKGYDWVAAGGWALLAIAVASTWLLAWYTLWSLPLAVIARDRRLLVATLCVQGLFIVHQTSPLFAPVQ